MLTYALGRLIGLVPVLAAVLVLIFLANQAIPGDPITVMLSDHSANVVLAAQLRRDYGLDQPLWRQFLHYVAGVLTGDFGMSFRFVRVPVIEVIGDPLKVSPVLAGASILVAIPIGVMAGVFAAVRRNSWADTGLMFVLIAGISVPNFALATFLVYGLAVKTGLLPVAGWGTLRQAVMPVIVLAIPAAAYIARLSRTYMLEVLTQDYIRTARAKGLRERLVIYRHALRNTLVPLITTIGIIFGGLLSGTFVVEALFNIPGLGRLAIQSIFARDYPVTMAIVLLFTLFYCGINLVVDLLYGLIDPRIRLA